MVVNDLSADLDASSHAGALEIDVAQIKVENAAGEIVDDVDIILGDRGGIVALDTNNVGGAFIDAGNVGFTQTVRIRGDEQDVEVVDLADGITVDARTGENAFGGELVLEAKSGAQTVEVLTGTGATSLLADSGSATVDASTLLEQDLTLEGSSTITVDDLSTDLAAGATSGEVIVNTAAITGTEDGSGNQTAAFDITAGTGRLKVDGDDSDALNTDVVDITIDASNLADEGDADENDDGLIETADADLELLGDAEYVIANNAASGEVVVDASALSASGDITLEGSGNFNLINTTQDVTAPDLTGRLTVTTAEDGSGDAIAVQAGSGELVVEAADGSDVITVDAAARIDTEVDDELGDGANDTNDDFELTARGAGEVVFNDLLGDVDASGLSGNLTASIGTTADTSFSEDVDIRLGSADATVNTNGSGVTLDADAAGSNSTVTLNETGDVDVFNAGDGITIDGSTEFVGELTVASALVNTQSMDVLTGSAQTTIIGDGATNSGTVRVDATQLADDTDLVIEGSDEVEVSNLQGDIAASNATGVIEATTVADAVVDVATGSNDMALTGTGSGGAVTVDASAMTDDRLDVDGAADFTVSGVDDGNRIDGAGNATDMGVLSGTLDVSLGDFANDVEVATGTGATSIDTGAGAQTGAVGVTVEAGLLADNVDSDTLDLLTLTGTNAAVVQDIVADTDASGLSGELTLTTADNSSGDGDIGVTLGTGSATLDGTASADTLSVTADEMGAAETLALTGSSKAVVTGLVGALDADTDELAALAGELVVTTGALDDGAALDMRLGEASATLTIDEVDDAPGTGIEAVVDAGSMTNADATLTLDGDGEVNVDALALDVDASALTGDLDVDSASDATLTVTAGTGPTEVTSTGSGADLTVDAGLIAADGNAGDTITYELVADGSGDVTVNSLAADLDASALAGELDVTTATDAVVDILAGSDNATIEALGSNADVTVSAAQMGSFVRLTAHGSGDVTANEVGSGVIVDGNGNADLPVFAGELEVNLTAGATGVQVDTGSNVTRVAGDAVSGSGDAKIDAGDLANDTDLTVAGSAQMEVTDLIGDLRTDVATGPLTVTTADNGDDNSITIETSEASTSITADHGSDTITVEAADLLDDEQLSLSGESAFVVKALSGDLDADALGTEPSDPADRKLDVTLSAADDLTIDSDRNANIDAAGESGGMAEDSVLSLSGSGDMTLDNVRADIDASSSNAASSVLSGDLLINTVGVQGSNTTPAMEIATGTGSMTVNGVDAVEDTENIDIRVNATEMADALEGTVLKLQGSAEYELVNNAAADGTNKVEVDLSDASGSGTVDLVGQGEFDLIETSADITANQAEGPLTITTRAGAEDTITVIAGSGDLTVDAENAADVITVDAATLVDEDNDEEVDGDNANDDFIVGNTDGTDIDGDSDTSPDRYELSAEGSGDVVVSDLAADLDASLLEGGLDVTLAASGDFAAGQVNDVDILLGASSADVDTLDTGATDVTLDATAMGSGEALNLDGAGAATVFGLGDGLSVDGASGDFAGFMDVYTEALGAGESVDVATGTNTTRVTGESGSVSIDATDLADDADASSDDDLTLRGSSAVTITALSADVMASGTTGVLTIDTAEDAGSGSSTGDEVKITAGSGDVFVTGSGASGDVVIDAGELGSANTATLDGEAVFTVDAVGSDVTVDAANGDEGALSGALSVNVADNATGVDILTGASDTTVDADSGDVSVDATAMVDDSENRFEDRTLTLDGSSNAVITGLVGEVDARTLTGTLDITTADNESVDDVLIYTGTGVTSVDSFNQDQVTIYAGNTPDDQTLTLTGDGDFFVNNLQGDIDADFGDVGLGDLSVNIKDPDESAASDIRIDSDRSTTVEAGLLEDRDTLELAGSGDITVSRDGTDVGQANTDGLRTERVDASASTGAIEINTAPISGDDANGALYDLYDIELSSGDAAFETQAYMKVIAGSGDLTVNGLDSADESGSGDSDIVDIFVDTAASGGMSSEDVLTLSGSAEYYIDGLEATLRASEDGDLTGFRNKDGSRTGDDILIDEANFPPESDDPEAAYPPKPGGIDSNLNSLVTGDMVINGASGANTILAGGGSDRIDGGLGSDLLRGAGGDDFIIGGEGDDELYGGNGDDLLYGGSGNDGSDFISGGDGEDVAMFLYTTAQTFSDDSGFPNTTNQPVTEITLHYNSDGEVMTHSEYESSNKGSDISETYTYSFSRTGGDNGSEVQVQVSLSGTDADGNSVEITDTVLSDVEEILFVQPDENPNPENAQDPNVFSGSVINVDTGFKGATIQEVIDNNLTDDGDRILVTAETYNEEAFVDKDLEFFIQSGSTGVTLSVDENYNGASGSPDLKVLSESDVTLNGSEADNEIVILQQEDFDGVDDDISGETNLKLATITDEDDNAIDVLQLGEFGNISDFDAASYVIKGFGGNDTLAVDPDSAQSHRLQGGSGDDFISDGQARDLIDGGSGEDRLISHGGDDWMLGGSGNDQLVLATRDDDPSGENGTVYLMPGGGADDVIAAALDPDQGIDLDAIVGGYTLGDDQIDFGAIGDGGGSTVDMNDLLNPPEGAGEALDGSTIDLEGFVANYVDGSGNEASVDAGGTINLGNTNTARFTASDLAQSTDTPWRDDFEAALGLQALPV